MPFFLAENVINNLVNLHNRNSIFYTDSWSWISYYEKSQQTIIQWKHFIGWKLSGDSLFTASTYMLVLHRTVVSTAYDFAGAFTLLFGAFYNVNFEYPAEAATTLEFIQRLVQEFASIQRVLMQKVRQSMMYAIL